MASFESRVRALVLDTVSPMLYAGPSRRTDMEELTSALTDVPQQIAAILTDLAAMQRCKDKIEKESKLNKLRGCL